MLANARDAEWTSHGRLIPRHGRLNVPRENTPCRIQVQSLSRSLSTIQFASLLQSPPRPQACYVLAHGAGAGMTHPFMAAFAAGLAQRGLATLRFQFPYM
ncbi:MAG: alpha/beta family hydrolase, partial [Rhodoplanes sp.]